MHAIHLPHSLQPAALASRFVQGYVRGKDSCCGGGLIGGDGHVERIWMVRGHEGVRVAMTRKGSSNERTGEEGPGMVHYGMLRYGYLMLHVQQRKYLPGLHLNNVAIQISDRS
jgi:hypothetical protein